MNKSELIENLSHKANLPLGKAENIVDIFFDNLTNALADDGRVEIRGFGAFSVKSYEGYHGRNPKTGEKIFVEPKKLPVWRTGSDLKKRADH